MYVPFPIFGSSEAKTLAVAGRVKFTIKYNIDLQNESKNAPINYQWNMKTATLQKMNFNRRLN